MQQRGEARERFGTLSASTTKAVESIKRSRSANRSSSSSPPGDLPQPATPLADIRHDVLVHAESLAKEVTALTLALKPPVTVEAVVAELDKLGGIVAKLSYVVELLPAAGALTKRLRYVRPFWICVPAASYGQLRAELGTQFIRWYILDLLEALQQYLPYATGALDSVTPESRNELLRAAKTLWTVVDRSGNLPRTELEAERQSWRDATSMLDDCLEELKDLEETVDDAGAEPAEGADDAPTDAPASDAAPESKGGDVSASQAVPAMSKERQRISATRHLLRLGRLLVHRLVTKSTSSLTTFDDSAFLDTIRQPISKLSALGDDIALELEPPQEGLLEVVEELCQVEDSIATELERVVESRGTPELKTSEAEWMTTWRKQRSGVRAKLDAI